MNKRFEQLARKAGFVFWKNETHGPGPGHIDWANNYDQELERFAELLVAECARVASSKPFPAFGAERAVREHFDLPAPRTYICSLLTPTKEAA